MTLQTGSGLQWRKLSEPHRTEQNGDRDVRSIMLISLFLVSHYNFLFIPCGRLSWLPVSFLLHVKYTLSYRNDECVFTELSCDCPIQQQASDDRVFHQLDQTQHHLCYHTSDSAHNPSTQQQSHHHSLTLD